VAIIRLDIDLSKPRGDDENGVIATVGGLEVSGNKLPSFD